MYLNTLQKRVELELRHCQSDVKTRLSLGSKRAKCLLSLTLSYVTIEEEDTVLAGTRLRFPVNVLQFLVIL